MRYGIKAIVGESFAEIFAGNCTAMGVPAVQLSPALVRELQATVEEHPDTLIKLDLPSQTLAAGDAEWPFELPLAYRNALVNGTGIPPRCSCPTRTGSWKPPTGFPT